MGSAASEGKDVYFNYTRSIARSCLAPINIYIYIYRRPLGGATPVRNCYVRGLNGFLFVSYRHRMEFLEFFTLNRRPMSLLAAQLDELVTERPYSKCEIALTAQTAHAIEYRNNIVM